jgi:hypothetical protein
MNIITLLFFVYATALFIVGVITIIWNNIIELKNISNDYIEQNKLPALPENNLSNNTNSNVSNKLNCKKTNYEFNNVLSRPSTTINRTYTSKSSSRHQSYTRKRSYSRKSYTSYYQPKTYIDSNGYRRFSDSDILVHRYVASKKLGRKLRPGEVVHHKNRNKQDNSSGNLWVFRNQYEHNRAHRYDAKRYGRW